MFYFKCMIHLELSFAWGVSLKSGTSDCSRCLCAEGYPPAACLCTWVKGDLGVLARDSPQGLCSVTGLCVWPPVRTTVLSAPCLPVLCAWFAESFIVKRCWVCRMLFLCQLIGPWDLSPLACWWGGSHWWTLSSSPPYVRTDPISHTVVSSSCVTGLNWLMFVGDFAFTFLCVYADCLWVSG